MVQKSVRWRRVAHTIIITIFILIVLFEGVRDVLPYWEFILAVGFVAVWMMGIRYERHVILAADLVDPDELKQAETAGYQWINWGGR